MKELRDDETTAVLLNAMATAGSARPPILRLTSGVLLGVHYHVKPTSTSSSAIEHHNHSNLSTFGTNFQFWDWRQLVPVGP